MRKLFTFLLTVVFVSVASSLRADVIVSYEPDEVLTEVKAGDIFAIYDSATEKYLFGSGAQDLGFDTADNAFKNTNPGWLFKLSELAGHYVLQLQNADGSGDYALWGNPNNSYLNSQPATGWCSFILSLNGEQYGQDGQDLALWDIEASGNGFKLKNVGTGLYLNSNAPARYSEEDAVVWTFCTLKETSVENPIEPGTYDATDANTSFFTNFIGIGENATFDPDTKVFKGGACGWQWADGADFDKYQYIVITVAQNVTDGGWQVHIKDANGLTISGDQYGADYMNLWIGAWNNHNCLKIDLEKIRSEQMFDIHHVTELWIDANRQDGIILGNAYATNQVPENNKNWNNEENGDFKLTIDNNKFATICLPFEASVAGAYVYEIAGKSADGLDLNMYNGILEAGKPYIIQSNENESGNVYFYKATATTVETAGENNGLIGTFEAITINNKDFYVLSGNKLYYADQDVNVGANKAYIDMTKVGSAAGTKNVSISFGDVTGIENIQVEGLNGKVYDLSGREIIRPAKGFYIANGKKMLIK